MPKHVVQSTIYDAVPHIYSQEEADAIIAGYPAHERDARAKGIPMLGSGRVFPLPEEDIKTPAVEIQPYWPQGVGLDLGWDHPTAAVRGAWDRDNDILYITAAYRESQARIPIVASAIKAWGDWIPIFWPHDGHQTKDTHSGKAIAQQYKEQGLAMHYMHSTHFVEGKKEGEGGYSLEAGVSDMLTRMETGRLKVFDHLNQWFEEFRMYHRLDGVIVKERDDLMSATRMLAMMMRHMMLKPKQVEYDPYGPMLTRGQDDDTGY